VVRNRPPYLGVLDSQDGGRLGIVGYLAYDDGVRQERWLLPWR
jgi:hypothetical protein